MQGSDFPDEFEIRGEIIYLIKVLKIKYRKRATGEHLLPIHVMQRQEV